MSRWWRKPCNHRIDPPAQPGSTAVEHIDHRTFLEGTRGRFTAVDFWAAWCAPCRAFAPVFEDVANRNRDRLTLAKCNIDENREVAALLGIQSIPTVVLFGPGGSEIDRIPGFLSRRQLERLLAAALDQARLGGGPRRILPERFSAEGPAPRSVPGRPLGAGSDTGGEEHEGDDDDDGDHPPPWEPGPV